MKAKIFNNTWWVAECQPQYLINKFNTMLAQCGFLILGYKEHYFEPQGFTALWLIGESHLAVHTFPEHGKAYVELSSCNEQKHNRFVAEMEREK